MTPNPDTRLNAADFTILLGELDRAERRVQELEEALTAERRAANVFRREASALRQGPPTDEEVERAAKAVRNRHKGFPDAWDEYTAEVVRRTYLADARLALEAAREPDGKT